MRGQAVVMVVAAAATVELVATEVEGGVGDTFPCHLGRSRLVAGSRRGWDNTACHLHQCCQCPFADRHRNPKVTPRCGTQCTGRSVSRRRAYRRCRPPLFFWFSHMNSKQTREVPLQFRSCSETIFLRVPKIHEKTTASPFRQSQFNVNYQFSVIAPRPTCPAIL